MCDKLVNLDAKLAHVPQLATWVACDGFTNWGQYCDPRLDQILHAARSTTGMGERAKL